MGYTCVLSVKYPTPHVMTATLGSSHPVTRNMDKQLRKWNNGCLLFIRLEVYSFRVSAVLPD